MALVDPQVLIRIDSWFKRLSGELSQNQLTTQGDPKTSIQIDSYLKQNIFDSESTHDSTEPYPYLHHSHRNRSGIMRRLAKTIHALTLVKLGWCIVLLLELSRLRSDSVLFGFMGTRYVNASRWGLTQRLTEHHVSVLVKKSHPAARHVPPDPLPNFYQHLSLVISRVRCCLSAFGGLSDKSWKRSKRYWISRCALFMADVSWTKYIGREGETGIVYCRAAVGTSLTQLLGSLHEICLT